MKCYIYCWKYTDEPINPLFYAGLGSPFKLSPDFQFAESVVFDTINAKLLLKQLEKTYKKSFYFVQIEDVVGKTDHRCFKCGLGWTKAELRAVTEDDLNSYFGSVYDTHLGSPLRKDGEAVENFITKITHARRCKNENCMKLYCGDCAPPTRGRSSNACDDCRPAKRWEQ
mgnify:CR=1 FL=1